MAHAIHPTALGKLVVIHLCCFPVSVNHFGLELRRKICKSIDESGAIEFGHRDLAEALGAGRNETPNLARVFDGIIHSDNIAFALPHEMAIFDTKVFF